MDINLFLPPLAGSFFGVIAGFAVNYLYQSYLNNKTKKKYKIMIYSELELCLDILVQDRIQLLPTDKYTSIINSGDLKLFDTINELERVPFLYNQIQTYNEGIKSIANDNLSEYQDADIHLQGKKDDLYKKIQVFVFNEHIDPLKHYTEEGHLKL